VRLDLPAVREEPTDSGYIELFTGRVRDECLNAQPFLSLDDRRARLEACWVDHN
jgi:putative transposase